VRRARRYASLLAPVLRSQRGRLPAPWKVTLATTYVCNHRCTHCGIWTRQPKNELTTSEFASFFAANPSIRWLDLTGGEPTSRPDLPAIIEAAATLPDLLVLHFPTNGTLPHKAAEAARVAVAATPAKVIVTVSLDGPPAVHDRMRGVAGAWNGALDTYRAIDGIPGAEVVFGMTLNQDNAHAVDETVASLQAQLGAFAPDALHLNVAQRSAHYYGNADMPLPDPAQTQAALRSPPLRSPTAALERAYRALVPAYLKSGASPVRCQALSASCFVDPWGTVYPCITEDRPLGSLRERGWSLADLWRDTADAADDMAAGRCDGCWTPCEAYPSLLGALPQSAVAALKG